MRMAMLLLSLAAPSRLSVGQARVPAAVCGTDGRAPAAVSAALLAVRDTVWRAWFAGDQPALHRLLAPELIVLGRDRTTHLDDELASAKASGEHQHLVALTFPHTDMQCYGDVAVLYSSYVVQLRDGSQATTMAGVATEVFVHRGGGWVNTAWQLTSR